MLPELHNALRQLLYERGRIDPRDVDIRFEAPTREWIDRLTRPTISLFLCDVQENGDLRQTAFEVTRGNGRAERRTPPRRVDLQYMVSALATDIDDQHRLLWRTLSTLMTYNEVPAELVPEEMRATDLPVRAQVARDDDHPDFLDVWSGLGSEPRSALSYVLTVPLDLDLAVQAPLVLTRTARYQNLLDADRVIEERTHIAGVVRGPQGQPLADVHVDIAGSDRDGSLTDREGRFSLHRVPPGPLTLHLSRGDGDDKTVTFEVPSESYDVEL
jgi:hypothetical protein